MRGELIIRLATPGDHDQIWEILRPVFRSGETYAIDPEIPRATALAYWRGSDRTVWVTVRDQQVIGTYYLRTNQPAGGCHVCNCGFVTNPKAQGQGVARAMVTHALGAARAAGYSAMQFNFVVSTNERALGLWKRVGFDIVGRVPGAFQHPRLGFVDALVLYRRL